MERKDYYLKPFENEREYMEQRVTEGIEKNRKGDATLRVKFSDGTSASDVKVSVKQKKHAFLHGANCFMLDEMETAEKNAQYKEAFVKVFNEATLPFYWNGLEPERGKPRYAIDSPKVYRRPAPDLCLEFCEKNGITPKLHCLNYDQWTPLWAGEDDIAEHKRLLENRFREISERYADRIHCHEVINEVLCYFRRRDDAHSTKFFFEDDLVEWSFQMARKYFPNNELIINEATPFAWDTTHYARSPYSMVIERAIDHGASIDGIGLQYHLFRKPEEELEFINQHFSPSYLYGAMDYYWKHFGKPLQITEVTFSANSASAVDEELQAQVLNNLYSMWFSHPSMEAIIYWNLVDGYAHGAQPGDMSGGENAFRGGLLRFDLSRKPAYDRLDELFNHRWRTEQQLIADANGNASFRGFYGDYEVTVEKNGQATTKTFTLEKGKQEYDIVL